MVTITAEELDWTLAEMRRINADETVVAVMPRMAQVWARKPARDTRSTIHWSEKENVEELKI